MHFLYFEIISYLLGSIPNGLLIAKIFHNIDIRDYGSHNIGATNVTRTLGKKIGALVLLLDGLKAVLSLFLVSRHYSNEKIYLAITTVTVILGHIFPIWLKFKGGKGIACLLFSLLFLDYRIGLFFVIVWLLTFLLFRVSALSALISTFLTTFFSIPFSKNKEYFVMMLIILIITTYKHKENIKRIINNEELKFNKNK